MMKKNSLFLLVVVFIASAFTFSKDEKKKTAYQVDPVESKIKWHGKKVTGEHFGDIALKGGSLELSGNEIVGGRFEVDMNSITNHDIKDEDSRKKLVGHLKSDDFFGVEQYPTSVFEITEVNKKSGNKYDITGDLTIRGITNSISFPATVAVVNDKVTAEAEIVIDRSKYNVKFGSGSFFDNLGDRLIYDDFTLNIALVANNTSL